MKKIKEQKADSGSVSKGIAKPHVVRRFLRDELISICRDAVVNHTKWGDRDSYSAQVNLQSIYKALTAGLPYTIDKDTDERTIWITFKQPIDLEKLNKGEYLNISSREDYFHDCDPDYETEMFDGYGIDFTSNYTGSYMPTRKRLEDVGEGNDWY